MDTELAYRQALAAEERAAQADPGTSRVHPTLRKGIVTTVSPLQVEGLPAANITGLVLRVGDVVWLMVDAGRRLVAGKTSLAEGVEVELAYQRSSSWVDLVVPAQLVGLFSRFNLTVRNPTHTAFDDTSRVGARLNGAGTGSGEYRWNYHEHNPGLAAGVTAPRNESPSNYVMLGWVGTTAGSIVQATFTPFDQRHAGLTAVAATWDSVTYRNAGSPGRGQAWGRWNPPGTPSLSQFRVGRITTAGGGVGGWDADVDYTLTGVFARS